MANRIAIVGAGAMGCSIAWRLAEAGADVIVLEKAAPGAEASTAAAGLLGAQVEAEGPGPTLDLALASRAAWPGFAGALRNRTGVDVGYLRCGALELAGTSSHLAGLRDRLGWMREIGLHAQLLNLRELRDVEPAVGDSIAGALWLPDDHQVDTTALTRALAAAASVAGAHFRRAQEVRGIVVERGRVRGVMTRAAQIETDTVVVATGAWTSLLPALPNPRTRVAPQHGQLVMLDACPPVLRRILVHNRMYVIPRADGRVVVGATVEERGFHKSVTAQGLSTLLNQALTLVPSLAAATFVRSWSGLRPRSLDGKPLLGEHRDISGLHFATGHHRNGILLTPITALAVAAGILGDQAPFDLAPFRP